jgi:hypothetical protein
LKNVIINDAMMNDDGYDSNASGRETPSLEESNVLEESDALEELLRQETLRQLEAAWTAYLRLVKASLPPIRPPVKN